MPHVIFFLWKKHAPNLLGVSASPGITPEIRKIKGNHGAGREQGLEMVIKDMGTMKGKWGKRGGGRKDTTERKGEKG